jgi:hypothetical protein
MRAVIGAMADAAEGGMRALNQDRIDEFVEPDPVLSAESSAWLLLLGVGDGDRALHSGVVGTGVRVRSGSLERVRPRFSAGDIAGFKGIGRDVMRYVIVVLERNRVAGMDLQRLRLERIVTNVDEGVLGRTRRLRPEQNNAQGGGQD